MTVESLRLDEAIWKTPKVTESSIREAFRWPEALITNAGCEAPGG